MVSASIDASARAPQCDWEVFSHVEVEVTGGITEYGMRYGGQVDCVPDLARICTGGGSLGCSCTERGGKGRKGRGSRSTSQNLGNRVKIKKEAWRVLSSSQGTFENNSEQVEQQANKRVVGQVRTNPWTSLPMFVDISPNRVKRDGPTRTFHPVDQAMARMTRIML